MKSNNLHIIYLPGVGDSDPDLQRRVVSSWRLWGVESELLHVNWASNETWPDKLTRILSRVEELKSAGKNVALVGASAGASAAVNAYSARPTQISGIVLICGKLKNASDIGPKYTTANPALVDSVTASDASLRLLGADKKAKILTRRAFFDEVVTTKSDSIVEGARNRVSFTIGHAITIGFQLVFGAPSFIRFLKRQNT